MFRTQKSLKREMCARWQSDVLTGVGMLAGGFTSLATGGYVSDIRFTFIGEI